MQFSLEKLISGIPITAVIAASGTVITPCSVHAQISGECRRIKLQYARMVGDDEDPIVPPN